MVLRCFVWISSLYFHKIQHGLELKIVLPIENDEEPSIQLVKYCRFSDAITFLMMEFLI